MAGDWIPVRTDIFDDPAVISIAGAVELDEYAVVGRLLRLWSWANRHLATGNAESVTVSWIDRYVGTAGFAAAMLNAGWLRTRSGGVEFPNFERWNSQSAKKRALTAKRVAEHKVRGNAHGNAEGNAPSVSEALPKGEERREEKRGKRRTPKPPPDDPQFDEFWKRYPRKENRAGAFKAWVSLSPSPELVETIFAAIERQKSHGCLEDKYGRDGRSVIPHPSSWLNAHRWEDQPPSSGSPFTKPAAPTIQDKIAAFVPPKLLQHTAEIP